MAALEHGPHDSLALTPPLQVILKSGTWDFLLFEVLQIYMILYRFTIGMPNQDSSRPQFTQNDPAFHLSVNAPPHLPGFYQQPIENNIIDGTDWIDFLWPVIHCTDFHRSTECFVSMSKILGKLHIQTKMLYTIYNMIEYQGYLESTVGPEIERKMSVLHALVIRQHNDFNPKTFVKTINCFCLGAYMILYCITLLLLFRLVGAKSSSAGTTCFGFIGIILVYVMTMVSETWHLPAYDVAQEIDNLNTNTFQLIWAVRNVAGLLNLIAESEGSQMSNVLHAELFLKTFRDSFLGRHQELSDLRLWLQELPSWTDKNFSAHHWIACNITYQALLTQTCCQSVFSCMPQFSSIKTTSIYQKVFGTYSCGDILLMNAYRQRKIMYGGERSVYDALLFSLFGFFCMYIMILSVG
ncbi:hypothetical protein EDD18DRAFT_1116188 [Armillaria luteobubalina]|uniref:Uncharacterized protein n=1 Tax=Armillaria luteobubalina TaxID=153913 RepID=A0AA39P029_9AGAR|nr:hypothetical protein EDD18DRAFT_1116188 [Armillaria luteobubalina]